LDVVMLFMSVLPRWQLMNKNLVATFRSKLRKKSRGNDWATDGRGKPKLCDIAISFEKEISNERELEPYVKDSGFPTLRAWVSEIRRLNPKLKQIRGYLYVVVKL